MKRALLIFLIGFVIILLLIGGFYLIMFKIIENKGILDQGLCGDGTYFGECSEDKPYFCDQGVLIQDIELCGCPEILEYKNGDCTSKYFEGEVIFDAVFFDFVLYKGVSDYLDGLPRSIEYGIDETPERSDFKFLKIGDELQRESLLILVKEIQNMAPYSKNVQAKIAINIVQNIPYEEADLVGIFQDKFKIRAARYPYQVIYKNAGSCEGKSELLLFILRELGYKTAIFYYNFENHEAVGIGCPLEYSYNNTGYCFVETTVSSPISFSSGTYLNAAGASKLYSNPEIFPISEGISLGENLDDYRDAEILEKILSKKRLNPLDKLRFEKLKEKYGLSF
jgi:hypothetical protein